MYQIEWFQCLHCIIRFGNSVSYITRQYIRWRVSHKSTQSSWERWTMHSFTHTWKQCIWYGKRSSTHIPTVITNLLRLCMISHAPLMVEDLKTVLLYTKTVQVTCAEGIETLWNNLFTIRQQLKSLALVHWTLWVWHFIVQFIEMYIIKHYLS